MQRIAVIQFPGSNCERETTAALDANGAESAVVQWNCTESEFAAFDAYVLPGGFSYQDRIRAGVIASKLSIMRFLQTANDDGKLILGICNGCQILAETGLIPDHAGKQQIEVALAPNHNKDTPIGFICDWTYVKVQNPKKCDFLQGISNNIVLPIPINHSEGRFIFKSEKESILSDITVLRYCTQEGDIADSFPVNPNASMWNVAGIGNKKGNVLALMPHPERATFIKQVPKWVRTSWKSDTTVGPWAPLFQQLCTN